MFKRFQRSAQSKVKKLSQLEYQQTDNAETLRSQIVLEHIRQAQYSFNLSVIVIAMSTLISFAAVGMLLSGKTTEGSVAATGSLLSNVCHLQMLKDARNRLDKSAMALRQQ
jgi:hypothetical protein